MKSRSSGLLLLTFFALLSWSCKEKVEGCMDITAVNWDASADKPCEDCCTYPSLRASFSHLYGDTIVRFDTTYLDDFDNPFRIAGIRYYLTDFQLNSMGTAYHPSDSIELELISMGGNVEAQLEDNFARVSPVSSAATLGNFENTDLIIDSIQFYVGLSPTANQVDPNSVESGHPLSIDSDSMYVDNEVGYIFMKIGIVPDTMTMDTVVYQIVEDISRTEIRLNWNKELIRGENVTIPLQIDYMQWFKGIDFVANPEDMIKDLIVNNLSDSFSIEE